MSHHRSSPSTVGALARQPIHAVRRLAFWGGVALPLAYTPLLFFGHDGQTALALVALLCLHVACLIVGHDYGQ